MALLTVEVTGTFVDGSGEPLTGTITFTPTSTVYAAGVPVIQPDVPITAQIIGGQLRSPEGNPLMLVATDNGGLSVEGMTGWWAWVIQATISGQVQPTWSFFLPYTADPVDLTSLANTPAGGGGGGGGGGVQIGGDLGGTDNNPTVISTHLSAALPVAQGGTGATSAPAALTALGAAAASALASEVTRATTAEGQALQKSANLSDLASASTARTNLGLGSAALLASGAVAQTANNLSDLASAASARTNLGLGGAAVLAASAVAQTANNLSDLVSASAARTNLGLGSAATQNSSAFDAAGAASAALTTAEAYAAAQASAAQTAAEAASVPVTGGDMTGWLAPKVVTLTQSGGSVAVNAAAGNAFSLALTASGWTIAAPSSPADGQVIRFRLQQDSTGSRTVTWATGSAGTYDFGTAGVPTLSTAASAVDVIGFEYCALNSRWNCAGSALGF